MNAANATDTAWPEEVTLMYEVTGVSNAGTREQAAVIVAAATRNGSTNTRTYTDKEECASFWKRRKECLWSAMAAFPNKEVQGATSITFDVFRTACVPPICHAHSNHNPNPHFTTPHLYLSLSLYQYHCCDR